MRNLCSLLLASTLALAAPAAALDVVYVVRHAQKNDSANWSPMDALRPLSLKGARCAGLLGRVLEHRGIGAVYASETARTLATGAAVSTTRDGVEVVGDDATLKPTAEFVAELRQRHADDTAILIVGHSNTVDDVVLAFRPDVEECLDRFRLAQPAIPDTQYGDLWRLRLDVEAAACRGVNRERIPPVGEDDCSTP